MDIITLLETVLTVFFTVLFIRAFLISLVGSINFYQDAEEGSGFAIFIAGVISILIAAMYYGALLYVSLSIVRWFA